MNNIPFTLAPEYREYVWGGAKLRPEVVPTAEAWIIYAGNKIADGEYAGRTLADLTQAFGEDLLGSRGIKVRGREFPVLVKILDCAQWLSLQVHPNNEQAKRLEGDNFFGKTEAWHVLEAEADSKLIAGMKPGTTAEALAKSIQNGTVTELSQMADAKVGDLFFLNPGTVHALGPGLLIYEIQQTSDITYRVYDWGRPQTETRKLHTEKALAVSNPNAVTKPAPMPEIQDGEVKTLAECEYFKLEMIAVENKTVEAGTGGESFHGLTVIEGQVKVEVGKDAFILDKFQTLLIPSITGEYQIKPLKGSRVLRAGA